MEPDTTRSNVILRLVSKNFKRIKCVEAVPNGPTVPIKGKNGSGKTSCLDSIHAILTGKVCDRPIRQGASKAEIECEFGDFEATLKITETGGPTLRVKSKTGVDIAGPRTFLKDHSNEILLQPVEFMRLGETPEGRRKQAENLRKLVGLDFTALNAEAKLKYDERTLVNRELDTAKKKLSSYEKHDGVPAEEVSIKTLQEQLNQVQTEGDQKLIAARKHNEANAKVKARWEEAVNLFRSNGEAIDLVQRDIAALEMRLEEEKTKLRDFNEARVGLRTKLGECEKEVAALVYQDEDAVRAEITEARKPVQQQILNADETNQKVRANKRHAELTQECAEKQKKSQALTDRLEEIEQDKKEQLASAKFPLAGLSFDETGILLNGLPLNQGSQAQQIKAVVAIGFAFKPRIPVVLVRDASILDEDSLKEMAAMAEVAGGQVWLECIESSDEKAIEIVEGEVAA